MSGQKEELAAPFGDLETLDFLGSGVSAEVYKVRSTQDGALYAMKKSKNELRSERERYALLKSATDPPAFKTWGQERLTRLVSLFHLPLSRA